MYVQDSVYSFLSLQCIADYIASIELISVEQISKQVPCAANKCACVGIWS